MGAGRKRTLKEERYWDREDCRAGRGCCGVKRLNPALAFHKEKAEGAYPNHYSYGDGEAEGIVSQR